MRVRRRRLTAFVATVGLLALAAAGVHLSEQEHDADVRRGTVATAARINEGVVTVTGVQVGTTVTRLGSTSHTTGMFVVVTVRAAATGAAELRFGQVRLLAADDASYTAYGSSSSVRADPGFATTAGLVFEVDPRRIDDLTLELTPLEVVSGYQQHVRIFLGITSANADQWRRVAANQVLTPDEPTSRGLP